MAKVGIFWVYKSKVIGRAIALDQGENLGDKIDSPDQHVTLWERLQELSKLRKNGTDYESVPRGRVVWFKQEQKAVVYMDKKLLKSTSAQKKVTTFFDLDPSAVQWKSDPHYTTGKDAIAKLFDV
jgi:hypothetical protein